MKKPLTKGERANLRLQLLRKARKNPEFRNMLLDRAEKQKEQREDSEK